MNIHRVIGREDHARVCQGLTVCDSCSSGQFRRHLETMPERGKNALFVIAVPLVSSEIVLIGLGCPETFTEQSVQDCAPFVQSHFPHHRQFLCVVIGCAFSLFLGMLVAVLCRVTVRAPSTLVDVTAPSIQISAMFAPSSVV
ncbi:hypothetical protein ElyMa_005521600 [Elysia marginata]|uniref:Uncharacterized protein n=1 Tax=Elysia marginata TaxID=1093978 RepID=A0AAV4EWF7_9GAST|nr:hypothetical protein ElyMa_005521600 [Elysia marginata]